MPDYGTDCTYFQLAPPGSPGPTRGGGSQENSGSIFLAQAQAQAGTGTAGATPGCSAASAGTAFGPKFVNYLSRFLLSYDIPSRRLWRARAAEIPIAWNKKQVSGGASSYLATTPTWLPR